MPPSAKAYKQDRHHGRSRKHRRPASGRRPADARRRRGMQALQNLAAPSTRQKIAGAVAIALAIALVMRLLLWNRAPEYAVLFSNLDERDGGQIIAECSSATSPQDVAHRPRHPECRRRKGA